MLAAFIAQFYDDKPPPPLLLVNHELPEQALIAEALTPEGRPQSRDRWCRSAARSTPWSQHAETNAREALERKLAESAGQAKLLEGVAQLFGLPAPPDRIEVYDNSHIMGTNAYGVMIVAGPGGLHQGGVPQIRHPRPDHARRRLRHDARGAAAPLRPRAEGGGRRRTAADWPDLVLIDGGAGQLSAARAGAGRPGRAATCQLVAIAKGPDRDAGREWFHTDGARAVPAAAARSGAVFPAAAARRGAPLRHHHPPRRAVEGARRAASWTRSPASAPRASGRC